MDRQTEELNFIISHNIVLFVDEITKEEIKSGGKLSQGEDYTTGRTCNILDKDYWKSAELGRLLMDDEPPESKIKLYIVVFLVFVLGACFLLAGRYLLTEEPKEAINDPVIIERVPTPTTQPTQPTQPAIKTETVPVGPANAPKNINALQFEIDSLKLALSYKDIDYEMLQQKNGDLLIKNQELLKENEELLGIIKKDSENAQNLTQERFYNFLGHKIAEQCEKAEIKTDLNVCKDLFFKYMENGK